MVVVVLPAFIARQSFQPSILRQFAAIRSSMLRHSRLRRGIANSEAERSTPDTSRSSFSSTGVTVKTPLSCRTKCSRAQYLHAKRSASKVICKLPAHEGQARVMKSLRGAAGWRTGIGSGGASGGGTGVAVPGAELTNLPTAGTRSVVPQLAHLADRPAAFSGAIEAAPQDGQERRIDTADSWQGGFGGK